MARTSLGKRVLLLATSLVVALVVGDLGFRWLGPPLSYSKKGFIRTPSGIEVPAGEIYHFMARHGELSTEGEGPRGRLLPLLDVRMGYEQPRWKYFDADGCIAVKNNSLGFRDEEFKQLKPPGEYRVLALGDSFTYGMGVRQQDTWPEVLEDLLAAHRGGPVQVINCGLACGNGARSAAEYAPWVESDGIGLGPDLVILGFTLNDFSDAVPMLGYKPPEYEPFLGGCSRILDFVVQWQRLQAVRQQPTAIDLDAIVARDGARWREVQQGMKRMHELLQAKGIPLVVAVFPMLSQLDGPYPYANLHRTAVDFCRAENIAVMDLFAAFVGRRDQDLWVHPTDQHPNDVAHRLFAEQIFAGLQTLQLLPPHAR